MTANSKLVLALFCGIAIGAVAAHELYAQAKPLAYVISEIEVFNQDGYTKEYVPLARKALQESGGQKVLAIGGKTVSLSGEPPRPRVVLSVYENLEKAQAAYTSPAYLEARKVGDKYGKLRIFAVEGVAQ